MSIFTGTGQTYYPIRGVANAGVMWTEPNGYVSSALVTAPDVAAWIADGNTPAAAAPPTYDELYMAAIGAGIALTSTGTSSLNATYPLDTDSISNYEGIYFRLLGGVGFPGGGSTISLPDMASPPTLHAFDASHATAFFSAISDYLFSLSPQQVVVNGWPSSNAVTIA
jgi:hypothetical protein